VAGLAAARCDGVSLLLMLGLAGAALVLLQFRKFPRSDGLIVAVFMLAGLFWGWVGLLSDAAKVSVDASWLDAPQHISAEVAEVQQQAVSQRLTLTHVQRSDGARLGGLVRLYVYAGQAAASGPWLPGDRIEVQARLHAPRNQHNSSGFDFVAWCFDRHIALLGTATGEMQRLSSGASALEHVRQGIRQSLHSFPDAQGGVTRALLLGEREEIPESVYAAFAATGAAHLLAISGLHVGLVAGFGFALCWFVLTRREAWIVRLPVRGLALLAGVLLAMGYAQLAGWPLPTQRAALMLAGAALAWWLRARTAPLNMLLAALMLILLLDSPAISSLSLWLSFVATAGILLWVGDHVPDNQAPVWWSWFAGLLAVTLIAALFTLPLVADVFGRLPVYSLPANLLATPLYTLFVLPLSLAGALLSATGLSAAAHALFALAASGVEAGNSLLLTISHWPAGSLWLVEIPFWLGAAYALGMGCAFFLLKRKQRIAAVCVCVLTLGAYSAAALVERAENISRLIVWDIGQGAASSLILPGGKVMVIDAAGRPGSRFNAGTTMADGLRGMGLTHVDVLLISHDQSDHAGGAMSLIKRMNRVSELWLADVPESHQSKRFAGLQQAVLAQGGSVRWLKSGDEVSFAGARGRVVWPPQGYAPDNVNDDSLVLHMRLPDGKRLLFTGDIESPVERALVARKDMLASDVLLMPHHGSATSSSADFVAAVGPSLAIAQTGFANRYGFPAGAVLQRYVEQGSELYNTADGAVVVDLHGGDGMQVLPVPLVGSDKRNRALQWWRHFL